MHTRVNTVIGYFREQSQAEGAIMDLMAANFTQKQIGFAGSQDSMTTERGVSGGLKSESLWDKIAAFFEGGDDRGTYRAREAKASDSYDYQAENFQGSLGTLGIPEEQARYFEYQLRSNERGALVTVQAPGR